jgi:hypothetical protein
MDRAERVLRQGRGHHMSTDSTDGLVAEETLADAQGAGFLDTVKEFTIEPVVTMYHVVKMVATTGLSGGGDGDDD